MVKKKLIKLDSLMPNIASPFAPFIQKPQANISNEPLQPDGIIVPYLPAPQELLTENADEESTRKQDVEMRQNEIEDDSSDDSPIEDSMQATIQP